MGLQATVNIKGATRFLRSLKDQVPFATSLAINDVAKQGQAKQQDRMTTPGDVFADIRRPAFIKRSVKLKPFANKRSLKAVVAIDPPGGKKNDVFSKHEKGGRHTAPGGGRLAIPTATVRPSRSEIVPRRKRPTALRQRGKSFIIKTRSGKEFIALFTGKRSNKSLQFLYLLEQEVPLAPSLEFEKTIQKVVHDKYQEAFSKAFTKALK